MQTKVCIYYIVSKPIAQGGGNFLNLPMIFGKGYSIMKNELYCGAPDMLRRSQMGRELSYELCNYNFPERCRGK
jgi:hypothetical protein